MTVDPVCSMRVYATPVTPISEHGVVVYSFCAAVCKRRFDSEPERFAGAAAPSEGSPRPSASQARQLGGLLRRLARELADPGADGMAPGGLPPVEQLAVLEIGEHRRVRMSELARRCGTPLSTMTGLVDRLAAKGYVRRVAAKGDRRVVCIDLTLRGTRVYQERLEGDMRVIIALLDALSSREQAAVSRALVKLVRALEAREPVAVPVPAAAPARGGGIRG